MLSACMVVRNEGALIERCLRSLTGLDTEIILIHDGPCEDDTLDIARRYTPHIFLPPFCGSPERHRPFAYAQARGEWLLNIDADEFLSPEMAEVLPELMARHDVNGYEFVWPLWDGTRPLTTGGPHRLVLMRRSAVELVGLLQRGPEVHGDIETRSEILHHQPAYNNFTWKTAMTKQRRWARLHSREITSPFSDFPTFNYSGPTEWPRRRRRLTRFSPVLAVPYGVGLFVRLVLDKRWSTWRAAPQLRLRVSFYMGLYRSMVELYVANYVYLEPLRKMLRRARPALSSRRSS